MSNIRVILKWVCTLPNTAWLVGWERDEGSAQAMGQLWSGSQGTSFPESQSSVFGGMCVGGWIYECCVQRHYAVLEGNGTAAGRRVVPGWGWRMSAAAGSQSPFLSLLPSSRGLFEQGHPRHGITRSITMPSPPAFPRQRPPAPGEHQEKTCTAAALLFCFPCPLFCCLCSCKLPIINFITAS